jgi:hypothetical protein
VEKKIRLFKQLKGEITMVLKWVPAKTEDGVEYLKAVGEPTVAQEDELFRQIDGVVAFTSVSSRSARIKGKKPEEKHKKT